MKRYLYVMSVAVLMMLVTLGMAEALSVDDAVIQREARRLIDEAIAVEPEITAFLMSFESENVTLVGLDYRIKSLESLKNKIRKYIFNEGMSIQEAVNEMHDVLRYTFCISDEKYTEKTLEILEGLQKNNYLFRWFANYWMEKNYKGINTMVHYGKDSDFIFEIQFHTPESFETKNVKTHKYYEIIRSATATEEEKQEAQEKNIELFDVVPIPEGAENIRWEAEYMKDAA